ncbi:MAG: exodeoxyribonuclease III [Spirochaetes bacterium GWF1_41_5]|nr:MAG: exodeoxyribonuclease III [Spirochaetes bacterium GWF1_41_5]
MKIVSWNINGLRAVYKKNFIDTVGFLKPDILCLQETKAEPSQLPDTLVNFTGYQAFFSSAEKKGYSGTVIYSAVKPLQTGTGIGEKKFDSEGRIVYAEYEKFVLFNIYFPNGKASAERLAFKMDFYRAFLQRCCKLLKKNKQIIVCGDVNTAHREIDLARPKENENVSGFLPAEREWIDSFLQAGFIDTFRHFHKDSGNYTWWDYKTRARERNIGWRIDYFFISSGLTAFLEKAVIHPDITGSDHAPVSIELSL